MSEFKEAMQGMYTIIGLSETDAQLAAEGMSKIQDKQEPSPEEMKALQKTFPSQSKIDAAINSLEARCRDGVAPVQP